MPQQKFTKTDITIIVLFFILYIVGYALLIEPKKTKTERMGEGTMAFSERQPRQVYSQQNSKGKEHKVKSLSDWPSDLGKYFYTIDIAPGYEMEDEEYEVIGESGGNLIVRRHNDWPDISGHFEWYCNEKLTTTQQMFDYVVAHQKAIIRQMQEVKKRSLSHQFDEASYYQDHYDEYQDDPEDEIRFPPEIFDANDE
jgi:hypothetical protein